MLGPRLLLATVGDVSTGDQFAEFLARNFALTSVVHGRPVSTRSAAHFARREMSRLLRRGPVQADLLVAGVDGPFHSDLSTQLAKGVVDESARSVTPQLHSPQLQPQLHWIDRAGGACEVQYGAHGGSAAMVLAVLDEGWRPGMSEGEALVLARECVHVLGGRYAASPQGWRFHVVDGAGARLAGGGLEGRKPVRSPRLIP